MSFSRSFLVLSLIIFFFCSQSIVNGQPVPAGKQGTINDTNSLALTIYHNGALFDHHIKVDLQKGENNVIFKDINPEIVPGSIFIKSPNAYVQSYFYQNKSLSITNLLRFFKGKNIYLKNHIKSLGKASTKGVKLLAYYGNKVIVSSEEGIFETDVSNIVFPSLPVSFSIGPEIRATIFSAESGSKPTEILYLSSKLMWQANYTGLLSPDDKQIEVQAYASLKNKSQMDIRNATIKLLAGNVRLQRNSSMPLRDAVFVEKKAMPAPIPEEPVRERLFEYHIYTIPGQVNLGPSQEKSLRLFDAGTLACEKKFVLRSNQAYYYRSMDRNPKTLHPDIILKIDTKGDKTDMPFPAGVFRVYKSDSQGAPIFVGQQRIPSVAQGEKIILNLGQAFDISARKKQLSFNRIKVNNNYHYSYESSYEIKIHNSKNKPVTVFIREEIPGDWSITNENIHHTKEDANHCLWKMEIPPSEVRVLTYRVRVLD